MSDVVIQIEGLSKQYRLGEVSTGSLHHDLNRWWHRVRGKEDPYLKVTQANIREKKNADYVWALRDISFEVRRGEVLGIIGRNGAGKSTLLKILSRITAPTAGAVRIRGRIGALLEVGTGFHQDLTGRENVFLNGAILGMTKGEVRAKLDEIVEFSGCAAYLDTPVKRYSSGMVVRLAFAVAAHLDPEILIVDEVLAVGDAEFQRKCLGKMNEVADAGRTVLFVSHNLAALQNLCQTAIWLDQGRVAMPKDDVNRVVSAYERSVLTETGVTDLASHHHRVVSPFQITRIEILGSDGAPTAALPSDQPVRIRLWVSSSEPMRNVQIGICLRANGVNLTTFRTSGLDLALANVPYRIECVLPAASLLPARVEMDVGASLHPGNQGLDYVRSAAAFSITPAARDPDGMPGPPRTGLVRLADTWSALTPAASPKAAAAAPRGELRP